MEEDRPRGRTNQKLREKVFNYYGETCWICGREGADTIDHLVMVSQGGSNDLENLRPAHGKKSSFCVGNYSRKRGKKALIKSNRGEQVSTNQEIKPDPNKLVITYGDGWVKKQFQGMTSTMYYGTTGKDLDDPFVQAFISKP
jgi:hypothetical protein